MLLDAVASGGRAHFFAGAARTPPGKLRIAVSLKGTRALAPPMLDPRCRTAVEETAELLGSLGHEVSWRGPKWGTVGNGVAVLYMRGVADDARQLPNRERLGRQVNGIARMGSLIPDSVVKRTKAAIPKHARRLNAIFNEADVLLLPVIGEPPVPIGKWDSRSGMWTLTGMTRRTGFGPPWNYVGNPAASVPAGFTQDGLPVSVQLVGRPDDEATLLSLAAQLEAERPWAERRPPVS
jgi:amidase